MYRVQTDFEAYPASYATLKMEALYSSEILVAIYLTTRCNNLLYFKIYLICSLEMLVNITRLHGVELVGYFV
jgi:hypothetical protein